MARAQSSSAGGRSTRLPPTACRTAPGAGDQGVRWVDASIAMNGNFTNYQTKRSCWPRRVTTSRPSPPARALARESATPAAPRDGGRQLVRCSRGGRAPAAEPRQPAGQLGDSRETGERRPRTPRLRRASRCRRRAPRRRRGPSPGRGSSRPSSAPPAGATPSSPNTSRSICGWGFDGASSAVRVAWKASTMAAQGVVEILPSSSPPPGDSRPPRSRASSSGLPKHPAAAVGGEPALAVVGDDPREGCPAARREPAHRLPDVDAHRYAHQCRFRRKPYPGADERLPRAGDDRRDRVHQVRRSRRPGAQRLPALLVIIRRSRQAARSAIRRRAPSSASASALGAAAEEERGAPAHLAVAGGQSRLRGRVRSRRSRTAAGSPRRREVHPAARAEAARSTRGTGRRRGRARYAPVRLGIDRAKPRHGLADVLLRHPVEADDEEEVAKEEEDERQPGKERQVYPGREHPQARRQEQVGGRQADDQVAAAGEEREGEIGDGDRAGERHDEPEREEEVARRAAPIGLSASPSRRAAPGRARGAHLTATAGRKRDRLRRGTSGTSRPSRGPGGGSAPRNGHAASAAPDSRAPARSR